VRLYFAVPYGVLKYTRPLPFISAFIAALKIGLMLLLMKDYGIYGVVAATLFAGVLEIIIMKTRLSDRFHYHYNVFKLVVAPGLVTGMVLILEPFFAQQFSWQLHLFYLVTTGGLLLWVYRNELKLLRVSKLMGG
jgi:peptidoglycan biosynthesis protein MviN/MurJ (putative lipid II flippase)